MFDQRHWNYRFVINVYTANNSKTYELIAQSNDEACDKAIELFKSEFNESGLGLTASIITHERV